MADSKKYMMTTKQRSMQSDEPMRPELSVVVLCYKAGEFINYYIPLLRNILDASGIDYELILVANYNAHEKETDLTPRIAQKIALSDPAIRVVAHEKKGMMGWDMKSGFDVARGEALVVIDGDGQMPPDDIVRVYESFRKKGFDMIQTYRAIRHDGWYRVMISRIYNIVFRLLFPGIPIRDVNSKPKLLQRSVYEKIRPSSDGWFIDAELVIRAHASQFVIGEIPTTFYKNPTRTSFVTFGAIGYFIKNLIAYRWKTLWK